MLLLAATMTTGSSYACEICGCGVGNYNPHMFPHLSKNFLSLSYQYRWYETTMPSDMGGSMINHEYYNSFVLTSQYKISKRIWLMGMIPFMMNRQVGEEGNKSFQRPGDIVLMGNYRLWDNTDKKGKYLITQTLLVGGGVKLPTGKHSYSEENAKDVPNPNFQAGSGSLDYLLNASYILRYRNFAMNAGATYKINTNNKDDYRFGNKFLGILEFKYIRDINKVSLIPHAGLMYENMALDKRAGITVDNTGGNNLQAIAGIDMNSKNIAFGVFINKPVSHHLGGGNIYPATSLNAHVSYSF